MNIFHGLQDKDRFEDYYTNFAQIVSDLETFLAAYLHAIFIGKTKTQQALDTITRFVDNLDLKVLVYVFDDGDDDGHDDDDFQLTYYCYRFTPVQNRSGIRACISEKFVEIFNWYESDLDEVHQIYEAHKVKLQIPEGKPLILGLKYDNSLPLNIW